MGDPHNLRRRKVFCGIQYLQANNGCRALNPRRITNLQFLVNVESRRGIFSYEVDEISDLCAILPRAEKLAFSFSKADALGSFSIISFGMTFPKLSEPLCCLHRSRNRDPCPWNFTGFVPEMT